MTRHTQGMLEVATSGQVQYDREPERLGVRLSQRVQSAAQTNRSCCSMVHSLDLKRLGLLDRSRVPCDNQRLSFDRLQQGMGGTQVNK
jgi:hypothetical protein